MGGALPCLRQKREMDSGAEAYHLEALRKQRAIDRQRERQNTREGREATLNTSKDFHKARRGGNPLRFVDLCALFTIELRILCMTLTGTLINV